MSQHDEYIVGTSPVPKWLRGWLMPYKKMNGQTGYEYRYRKGQTFCVTDLDAGDSLVYYGGDIYIQRKEKEI